MFDFSVGELLLTGTVALVVIGPERLPKVARTAGAMVARLQRYVNGVKADIQREVELENLKRLEAEMNEAGRKLSEELGGEFASVGEQLQQTAHDAHQHLSQSEGVSHSAAAEPPPLVRPPRDRR